jgi:predicted permease
VIAGLARLVVGLASRLVPRAGRERWREEWLGEIRARLDATPGSRRGFPVLRPSLGAFRDAWAVRRETRVVARIRVAGASRQAGWGNGLGGDFRQAVRQIAVRPGLALVTVASLALGLAVSTAMFSLLNAVLFAGRPGVEEHHSLSRVSIRRQLDFGIVRTFSDRPQYEALVAAVPPSLQLLAQGETDLPIDIGGETGNVRAVFVSANYFDVLGTTPLAGRLLGRADDRLDASEIVIDAKLWRERFDESPGAIGAIVDLGGRPMRIAGVAPRGFTGWSVQIEIDEGEPLPQVWAPLAASRAWSHLSDNGVLWLDLAVRRAPGVSERQAEALLGALLPSYVAASSRYTSYTQPPQLSVMLRSTSGSGDSPTETALGILLMMLGPLTVLGIGCANVANLRLARASERARDLAVRLSLGGSRWRVTRPLVIEALMLTAVAAGAGSAGATAILAAVEPILLHAPFDARVFAFVTVTAGFVVLVSGLAPAWLVTGRLAGVHSRQAPQAGGVVHSRLRHALVIAQVALSLALLTIGALSIRTLLSSHQLVPGDAGELLLADVDVTPIGGSHRDAGALASAVATRLKADPRVRAVTYGDSIFFRPGQNATASLRASSPQRANVRLASVHEGWFAALGQRLIAGRLFGPSDRALGAIVVNETMAKWIGGDAVVGTVADLRLSGDLISLINEGNRQRVIQGTDEPATVPVQIVGVVTDGPRPPDSESAERVAYRPFDLTISRRFTLVVSTEQPGPVARDVRGVVAAEAGRLPGVGVETLDQMMRREMSPWRYLASGFSALGGVALLLAASGLYAVLAYVVSLRTREIGVRVAVGARPADVLRLVFRQALRIVGAGVVAGMVITVPVTFAMRAVFLGVSPVDPLAFGTMAALLLAVGALASAVPARRAARIDPVLALRSD